MCLSLCGYQSKTSKYSYGLTYLKSTYPQTKNIQQTHKTKELKCNKKRKSTHHKRKNKKQKKGTKIKYRFNWKTRFKMAINTYLSIIPLNVNGLNALIKRQSGRLDSETRTYNMLPTGDPLQGKRHIQIESKGVEKLFHANGNDKKVGVAILISDKIDFKTKAIKKDKGGHYHNDKRINTRRGYHTR